ncbi:MAG: PAS-domain containing protein, partial [Rhodospirillales bacterium]|nr:PAS-domain containing protein [Rhodospirillales bacterium]
MGRRNKRIANPKKAEEDSTLANLVHEGLDCLAQGMAIFDSELRLKLANKRFVDMFGYPPELVEPGTPFADMFRFKAERGDCGLGDVDELVRERVKQARNLEPHLFERVRADGTAIEVRSEPLPGGGFVLTLTDITERQRAEEALRDSEDRFKAVFDNSPVSITLKDLDGRYLLANAEFLNRFGLEREGVLGRESHDFLPGGFVDRLAELDRRVLDEKATIEEEVRSAYPDGGTRYVLITKFPILGAGGEPVAIGTITNDITERKGAEEALRVSEARLRGAIESMQEGFVLFDADDRLVEVNDVYRRINPKAEAYLKRGMRFEDLIRANVERGWMVEALDREEKFIRERMERHRNPKGSIIRQFSDGKWYILEETRTPEGGIALTFTDITEQKQAEEALREAHDQLELRVVERTSELTHTIAELRRTETALLESEKRYRDLVENDTAIINRFLPDTTLTFVNGTYARFRKSTPEDLIGKRYIDWLPDEDKDPYLAYLASFTPEQPVKTREMRTTRPDGTIGWFSWSVRAFHDDEG